MKNDKDIQLIEDYLDGLLKGKEPEAFRQRLETDEAFAKAYKLRKKLAGLWEDAGEYQQTKDRVREVMDSEKRSVFYRRRKNYTLIAIAASIALLFGVYWLFLRQDGILPWSQGNRMAKVNDSIILREDKPERLARIEYHIQLVSPVINAHFNTKDTLVFRWKAPDDTVKVRFGILDGTNHQMVFYSGVSLSDSLFTLNPGMLPPGKYAWYLHDTLTMNYFTIK